MDTAYMPEARHPDIRPDHIASNIQADFLTRFKVSQFPYKKLVQVLKEKTFLAVLIDIDDKTTDGLYTPYSLRRRGIKIPIIGVSEDLYVKEDWPLRTAEFLDRGGDYLLKFPPNPSELDASINAAIRRMLSSPV